MPRVRIVASRAFAIAAASRPVRDATPPTTDCRRGVHRPPPPTRAPGLDWTVSWPIPILPRSSYRALPPSLRAYEEPPSHEFAPSCSERRLLRAARCVLDVPGRRRQEAQGAQAQEARGGGRFDEDRGETQGRGTRTAAPARGDRRHDRRRRHDRGRRLLEHPYAERRVRRPGRGG